MKDSEETRDTTHEDRDDYRWVTFAYELCNRHFANSDKVNNGFEHFDRSFLPGSRLRPRRQQPSRAI